MFAYLLKPMKIRNQLGLISLGLNLLTVGLVQGNIGTDTPLPYGAISRTVVQDRICSADEEDRVYINDNMCGVFSMCQRLGKHTLRFYQYECPEDHLFDHMTMRCHDKITCEMFLRAMILPMTGPSLKRICPGLESHNTFVFHNSALAQHACGEYEECTGPHQHVTRQCPPGVPFNDKFAECDPSMTCADFLPEKSIDCSKGNKYRAFWFRDPRNCRRAWTCRRTSFETDEQEPYYQLCHPGQKIKKHRSRIFRCVTGECASTTRITAKIALEEVVSCEENGAPKKITVSIEKL